MTPDRWKRIEEVFEQAAELAVADRDAFLRYELNEDEALRAEVEALLEADNGADDFLGRLGHDVLGPALEGALADGDPLIGRQVGAYRIAELLGHGGMGTVYRAIRADGAFEQEVALKLVRRDLAPELVARFRAERRILARLEHPGIARIYDGGLAEDGRPYLAMELVRGEPITDFADRHELDITERLRLFAEICDVLAFAHRRLVIHRDLKPSNILVTDTGEVKLLDFGIAKLLEDEPGATVLTQAAIGPMTPEYAAPEQIRGDEASVVTDVYALGVLLYELLTGRRPYRLPSRARHEIERIILEEEPTRPSTAVTRPIESSDESRDVQKEIGRTRRLDPVGLRRRLSGDLDVIVLKALRKEPERRYPSAEAFGDDVRRHLTGFPVSARPESWSYVAGRFVRRNVLAVSAAALILLSLLGGLGAALWQAERAEAETVRAEMAAARAADEAMRAEETTQFMIDLFATANPLLAHGGARTAEDMLQLGLERSREALADRPAMQTHIMNVIAAVFVGQGRYDEAESLILEAAAIREEHFPPPSAEVGEVLHTLGTLQFEQDRIEEAVATLGEALAMRREVLEPGSEHLVSTLNNYGLALWRQGAYDDAAVNLEEAAEGWLLLKGEDSPEYATVVNNLGLVHRRRADFDQAAAFFRRAASTMEAAVGATHPSYGIALMNLADALVQSDRHGEAEGPARDAGSILTEALGADHPASINATVVLARSLKGQSRDADAVRAFQDARERAMARHGAESDQVARIDAELDKLAESVPSASHSS